MRWSTEYQIKIKIIKNGDLVKIDTGAYIDGFHGDSCISICVGEVSPKSQKLSDVAYKALRGAGKLRQVLSRCGWGN